MKTIKNVIQQVKKEIPDFDILSPISINMERIEKMDQYPKTQEVFHMCFSGNVPPLKKFISDNSIEDVDNIIAIMDAGMIAALIRNVMHINKMLYDKVSLN